MSERDRLIRINNLTRLAVVIVVARRMRAHTFAHTNENERAHIRT